MNDILDAFDIASWLDSEQVAFKVEQSAASVRSNGSVARRYAAAVATSAVLFAVGAGGAVVGTLDVRQEHPVQAEFEHVTADADDGYILSLASRLQTAREFIDEELESEPDAWI